MPPRALSGLLVSEAGRRGASAPVNELLWALFHRIVSYGSLRMLWFDITDHEGIYD
jgi:hypothetical protein